MNTSWKNHINTTARKISRSIGILNSFLPYIKLMINNALILSYINYGLLLWGYADRIYNLQKNLFKSLV